MKSTSAVNDRTNRLFSVPQYLLDKLAEEASKEDRSGNAQLIQILKDRYGEEKANGAKTVRTRKTSRRQTVNA